MLPAFLRQPVFGLLGAVYPKMDWAPRWMRAKATLLNLARDTTAAYFNSVSVVPESVRRGLFSASMQRALQGYEPIEVLRRYVAQAQTDDSLSQIQYADLKTYLPGDILTKVDRASMAKALEVRVPLLDHELVQWVATLPSSLKLKGREGKYCFKKALEPHLPKDVLYRPKMGFAVPLKAWFRGPLRDRVRQIVTTGSLVETGFFDMPYLTRLVDEHQSGAFDHSSPLWSLMMFESFLRNVHDRPRTISESRSATHSQLAS
jgi:asparagine synthase (glutamine-hydrolysing)